ncbi:MAG TPA: type II toxin-antitoxin system RelE/ParE family toxin [Thermoanaerobaculia bacterium]|nr:type II toxin-antitoxin system RelE/ParE family toxin [Thermoanaerobaculia bacterium]
MKTAFRKSFERDLKRLRRDQQLLDRVGETIEAVEAAAEMGRLPGVKKLGGGSGDFYRLRIGDYRIGLELDEQVAIFVRCLHRSDIYRYFP